jgi:hypothetical protein
MKRKEVLQVAKGRAVTHGAKEPSIGSKFFAAADNLKDFLFDFAFKLGIELVSVDEGELC